MTERKCRARFGALAALKFRRGLTEAEQKELEALLPKLHEYNRAYYEPALRLLRSLRVEYVPQTEKESGHCWLIAVLNALRYLGHKTPAPGSPAYEKLVSTGIVKCGVTGHWLADGSCLQRELNFRIKGIPEEKVGDHLPVLFNHWTVKIGYHSSLVVEVRGDKWLVVNFEGWHGKNVQWIDRSGIKYPSDRICGHWAISR